MSLIKLNYEKLPYQKEFHDLTDFYSILSAGMGAGKTFSLVMKMFKLMTINKGLPAGLLAPDLKMFKRDVLPTIEEICRDHHVPFKFVRSDSMLKFPTTRTKIMVFHGEDDGRSIRGPNLAFGLVNEVTLLSRPAFDAFAARIRLKNAPLQQIAMSGTPEGFNWFYRDFIEKPRPDTGIVYGDMRQNPHISKEYADRLWSKFDEKSREAYVSGKFVNMAGKTAVYAFNRQKHGVRGTKIDRRLPVWIAADFNVDPMAASIWQPVPIENGKILLRGIGEIKLRDASTDALSRALIAFLNDNLKNVAVFPDPAGKARRTSSQQSDILIMEQWGFKDQRYKPSIVSVRGCINALNAKLQRNEIEVDLDKMPETIADLEQCSYRDGTFELDKRDPARTHWLDGLKNMVDYEFPIGVERGGWRVDQIR